jgi:hypothetical protein
MIERIALIGLLAGCVLFGAIVFAEIATTPRSETAVANTAPPQSGTSLPVFHPEIGPQHQAMVTTILARPLFSATRRPPARDDSGGGDTSFGDTRLTGIVTQPGHRFAIFAPVGAKPLIVGEGDSVSGWRVETITPREVSLTGPAGTKTLQPRIDPNLVPPAAPPMASAIPTAVRQPVRPGIPPPPVPRPPLRPNRLPGRR